MYVDLYSGWLFEQIGLKTAIYLNVKVAPLQYQLADTAVCFVNCSPIRNESTWKLHESDGSSPWGGRSVRGPRLSWTSETCHNPVLWLENSTCHLIYAITTKSNSEICSDECIQGNADSNRTSGNETTFLFPINLIDLRSNRSTPWSHSRSRNKCVGCHYACVKWWTLVPEMSSFQEFQLGTAHQRTTAIA